MTIVAIPFLMLPGTLLAGELPITIHHFDLKNHEIGGQDWSVIKYPREREGQTEWCARFEVHGTVLHDFCGGTANPDWVGFLIWGMEPEKQDYLMILWTAGGAHSPNELRIIALRDDFPLVYSSDGASFDCLKDLDGDGHPEIIAYSLSFMGFYHSAIMFSMADSPAPQLIATYDKTRGRFMWANSVFPEAQKDWLEIKRNAFLEAWPEEDETISVNIAVTQHSKEADAYRLLMRWAVGACYVFGEKAACSIIEKYTDPVLAVFAKHSLQQTLFSDRNYQLMVNNPVALRRSAP
ncbi:MAG TPA: hypothetical protein ENN65_04440 [Candidatus Hydrogenedentes bacterium]|nr:hypothetical protein [Candidatus Hydrogenedentota bacterium]